MEYATYSKVNQESSDASKSDFSEDEGGSLLMSQQPKSFVARLSYAVKRSWWVAGPLLWLLSLLATWIIASVASKSPYDISVGLDTELELFKPHIEMYKTTFSSDLDWDANGTLWRISRPGSLQYVGDPSPEIDANWEDLTQGVAIDIKGPEAKGIEGTTYQKPDGSWFLAIEAFHQLHCLNMIRKALDVEHYGINEKDQSDTHPWRMHIEHCIDALREAIMCRAEVAPIPMEFNAKYRMARPAFVAVEHTCRNFTQIRDFMSQYKATQPLF
ncbi:uncharacterized protein TRUGW13939_11999 [Talaromyces rugulosus]|uniref:Cyclochlorotine biosynthesis protein O n=1 Tax=Talaromyces rugulosus TaxID=121627 RepID=A0A7H8RJJ4_TALRU|nr:uncharacterized protein TRUGW13939_11999 [Talaromyces rugulosus]QKX64823.1 hypothetical protein TRUGW13939_11999 [Talaromyces rugulosus]